MATMLKWLLFVLSVHIAKCEVASQPFRGNSREVIQVLWVRQSSIGGMRNISVRHNSYQPPVVLWHVNDRIVAENDLEFRTYNLRTRHENVHGNDKLSVASILLPEGSASSLTLQLVLEVHEVIFSVNIPAMDPGSTRLEYPPHQSLNMDLAEHIQYDPPSPLQILTSFETELIDSWVGTRAAFTGIDECVSPPTANVKKEGSEFLQVTDPSPSSLSWNQRTSLDDPNVNMKYVVLPQTNQNFWGLLRVSSGLVSTDVCNFFGGVKVMRTAFLRPPPHGDFFTKNVTVFLKHGTKFYSQEGGNIDITISALGGSEFDWYGDPLKEAPTIRLYKHQQEVTAVDRFDIKRLFEKETIFQFRNVHEEDSGTYRVEASMDHGRATAYFTLYVHLAC